MFFTLILENENGDRVDMTTTANRYMTSQIEAGRAVSLNFKWLQSDSFISTVTECGDINAGTYYLAWVGRSNNTHPKIKSIKIMS